MTWLTACTAADFTISDGYVEAETVECPAHLATFYPRTARALKPTATKAISTLTLKLGGD